MIVRVQRGCILCAKLGGTAEVKSFCPSRDIRIKAFFMYMGIPWESCQPGLTDAHIRAGRKEVHFPTRLQEL